MVSDKDFMNVRRDNRTSLSITAQSEALSRFQLIDFAVFCVVSFHAAIEPDNCKSFLTAFHMGL